MARVLLLDRQELEPGQSSFARFRLEAPLVALPGDRFVDPLLLADRHDRRRHAARHRAAALQAQGPGAPRAPDAARRGRPADGAWRSTSARPAPAGARLAALSGARAVRPRAPARACSTHCRQAGAVVGGRSRLVRAPREPSTGCAALVLGTLDGRSTRRTRCGPGISREELRSRAGARATSGSSPSC